MLGPKGLSAMCFCDGAFPSRIPRVLVLSFALTFPDWSLSRRECGRAQEFRGERGSAFQPCSWTCFPRRQVGPQHPRGPPARHQRVPGPVPRTPPGLCAEHLSRLVVWACSLTFSRVPPTPPKLPRLKSALGSSVLRSRGQVPRGPCVHRWMPRGTVDSPMTGSDDQ